MIDFLLNFEYLLLICMVGIFLFGSAFFVGIKSFKRNRISGNLLIFGGGGMTVLLLALLAIRLLLELFWP